MAVYFHSSAEEISVDLGEYQEFTSSESRSAEKLRWKPLNVIGVSFGVLCIVQAVLNVALRLTLPQEAKTPASESYTTKIPALLNTTGTRTTRCPPSWVRFESSCYFISSHGATFDSSRRDCEGRGAWLVKVDSRHEQAFLTGFSPAVWIGMTDRKREGTWVWLDGTPVDMERLQWAPGQPDNSSGGEDCGDIRTMNDFIGLNDSDCSNRIQWICEKPLDQD